MWPAHARKCMCHLQAPSAFAAWLSQVPLLLPRKLIPFVPIVALSCARLVSSLDDQDWPTACLYVASGFACNFLLEFVRLCAFHQDFH